jgi:hypothetical protein
VDGETIKKDLLDKVRSARAEWDALIARVPGERLTEPGVEIEGGEWSVKDVVAHVAIYEDWMAQQINAGGPNIPHEVDTMAQDQRNAWIFAHHRSLDAQAALHLSAKSHQKLIAAIEALSPADLMSSEKFEWTRGRPVHQLVPHETYLHYEDHAPGIRGWLGLVE